MIDNPPTTRPVRRAVSFSAPFAAGALLFTSAMLTLLQGISALVNEDLITVGPEYAYNMDTGLRGWINIALAILLSVIAIGLIAGAKWARATAIVMASISIIVHFLWMPYYPPYYPVWSLLVIALDVIVIWAVATWGPAPSREEQ
jgi:hypothetical protein